MSIQKKPYLIVPFLFEQPTWGGEYICEKKGWLHKKGLEGKKIGQSYELYGKSLLAQSITTTEDPLYSPDAPDAVPISIFAESRPFPLIKFTQAKGNSFQLHIRPNITHSSWQPKAESWYFLENGKMTFGVKKGSSVQEYKKTCIAINEKMKGLSESVRRGKLDLSLAKKDAAEFISAQNPWQFVNVHSTQKGDVVDLSGGGLHHSWEEDSVACPLGNIVYEVQQDVEDPISTMRSFDQGKFKSDGSIREIQIEDYFTHIDLDETRNTLHFGRNEKGDLFDTPHYSLISLSVNKKDSRESTTSFHHLFVEEGKMDVVDQKGNRVTVGTGHSCFIPQGVEYSIDPVINGTVLLTYLR